eukprot:PhM_4_TR2364/c0_g1_i1/m.42820
MSLLELNVWCCVPQQQQQRYPHHRRDSHQLDDEDSSTPFSTYLRPVVRHTVASSSRRNEPRGEIDVTNEVLFHDGDRAQKFTLHRAIFEPSYGANNNCAQIEEDLLCNEPNTLYLVLCAGAGWSPAHIPRPNALRHFRSAAVYEYSNGMCLVHVTTTHQHQSHPSQQQQQIIHDTNNLLLTLTGVVHALQQDSGVIPSGQHPVTKHLRASGYLQQGIKVVAILRLETSETPPEDALRALRYLDGLRLRPPSHRDPYNKSSPSLRKNHRHRGAETVSDDIDNYYHDADVTGETHAIITPTPARKHMETGNPQATASVERRQRSGSKALDLDDVHFGPTATATKSNRSLEKRMEGLMHENIELRDLTVKMAAQLQTLQSEHSEMSAQLRGLRRTAAVQGELREQYEDMARKTRDMEKREIERIRANILSKSSEAAKTPSKRSVSTVSDASAATKHSAATSSIIVPASPRLHRTVQEQSNQIGVLRKRVASLESELTTLRRRERERADKSGTVHVACAALIRHAKALEESCERLGPAGDQNAGVSAVRAALLQMQVTTERVDEGRVDGGSLQSSQTASPFGSIDSRSPLVDVRQYCQTEMQRLGSVCSLIDTLNKLEHALRGATSEVLRERAAGSQSPQEI